MFRAVPVNGRPGPPGPPERRPPPAEPWYLEFRRPPAPRPLPPPPRVPPPVPAPPKPVAAQSRSNRWPLIGVGITGLLALALLVILVLRGVVGGSGPVELDVLAAQDGVRQVLTDPINGYGRGDVTGVHCNTGVNPRVRKGATFTCAVVVDGAQRQVLVEFSDDAGTYAVDRPR